MDISMKSQEGIGLIAVLIGLGLFSFLLIAYSTSVGNQAAGKKIAESKELSRAIESAIANEAFGIVKDINSGKCLEVSKIQSRPLGFGPNGSNLKYSKEIPDRSQSPAIKNAIKRCLSPQLISPVDVGKKTSLYFCMKLDPNKKFAFVEYSINFQSTSTKNSLACNRIFVDRSSVAQVAYAIYFQGPESTYKYGTSLIKINN